MWLRHGIKSCSETDSFDFLFKKMDVFESGLINHVKNSKYSRNESYSTISDAPSIRLNSHGNKCKNLLGNLITAHHLLLPLF